MSVSKNTIFSNFIWRFLERVGAQLVSFVVSIILARILNPEDYGTVALVSVFINILGVFVDSGLGTALIQKKEADDVDFSTVFYTNICFCLIIYVSLFFIAPFISRFYNKPELSVLIRVSSIIIIISGLKNIQQAYVSRTLQFKRFFFATLGGTITAAVIGILMAYKGFGVWALVAQQLVNATIDTLILWLTVRWRPILAFSAKRLKTLFSYGWKLLLSGLLESVYTNLRQLIIGKKYTSLDLAFYNKGEMFPKIIVNNINSSIDSVLLPAMSIEQDDSVRVKNITRRAIKVSTYCIAPIMMGIVGCAPSLIQIILTDKWLP